MTPPELAPKYDPSAIEDRVYQRWLDADVFSADVDSTAAPYVIVIPPPNVTAVLHMGHGLNNTIQDVLIRFERMRGREALWLPGTDHAGIATQNVVERQLAEENLTRHDVGRDAFVEQVWTHVRRTGGAILDQLKSIGSSCDWSRTRFTLDDDYYRAVMRVFVLLYRDGLIYRGHRVIHWCPRCLTALSDEEAEFRDKADQLYHIRYRIEGGGDVAPPYVIVATTRPETMFGDVALVHHPDDERFAGLTGRNVTIPLSNVSIPIATSERVEREFGTGLLKVTPAHDANDFEIANELEGHVERPLIMDEHGRMAEDARVPAGIQGLDRDYARKYIVELLRQDDLLEKVEPLPHAVRHCYRCDTVVEPRLSDQWFVRMKPLAEPALAAYHSGEIRLVPERWGKTYENWLTEIRDWNISRQLWWGHRIPAWYCQSESCGHITVTEGTDVSCEQCGGPARQDDDVLDTWFSSWLWPFATLGWPDDTPDLARFYPGHTLVTSPDIIFFWVARMIMAGYHFLGQRPFETVYLHGVVRDPAHRKMSKSLGNGIDPLEVVHRYGADAMRYSIVLGAGVGTDVILDPGDLEASFAPGRNFANKLWNVGRLAMSHLGTTPPHVRDLDPSTFEVADRWILSRAQRAIRDTTTALDRFRVNEAAETVYHFIWDDLADWYLEQIKPRLYGTADGGDIARAVLLSSMETALMLLHPVMPYITEELWQHLPGERVLLAGSPWPQSDEQLCDDDAETEFGRVKALVTAIRSIRAEYGVAPGSTVDLIVRPADRGVRATFAAELMTIQRLAKVGTCAFDTEPTGVGSHAVLPDGSEVFVALGDAIDVAQECERIAKEVERLDTQLDAVIRKLANEQFTSRAPTEVVEREREKERSWREQRETLSAKLQSLGC